MTGQPVSSAASTIYAERLKALREELRKRKLDGFIAPIADEYQNENLPPSARRVEFLTGFTGSAGMAVILTNRLTGESAFFTDGRYLLQAARQIPSDLFTIFDNSKKAPSDWLREKAGVGLRIGFDPLLHTADSIERLQRKLAKDGVDLTPVDSNPIDAIWSERPAPPCVPVVTYDLRYAGVDSSTKRRQIAEELKKDGLHAALVTDPASIAWLLNVRGGDVPCSPLPLSTAIIRADASVEWFIDPRKITNEIEEYLGSEVLRYSMDDFPAGLKRLGEMRSKVKVDPQETSFWAVNILEKSGARIERGENPCLLPKACKNATEIEGMRAAHRRDGAAVSQTLCWLDENVASGKITELEVEKKLLEYRSAMPLFQGPSFAAIVGAGLNGAIVHYRATDETNVTLQPESLLLLDSGGQYLDGTTDVTRTIAIGNPSPEMRDRFTRVLKGHIALASIVFPEGTSGAELEVLARQFLWEQGLDYEHSTGHGIGCYLNVHEGPQGISRRSAASLKPGMILTNEPGFYRPGHYGIRIENVQIVIERHEISTTNRKMLGFEPLTLVPIDRRLIVTEMLLPTEREWLNEYHARVRQTLRPLIDKSAMEWLEKATDAI